MNAKGFQRAAWSGIGLALLFGVVNGLMTHVLNDGQTLDEWVSSKVGA